MRRILSIAGLVVALAGFIPTDSGAECPTGLPGSGSGDVTGPASSTDNAIARFDGTGGKTLQDSGCTIDDNAYLTCQAATSGNVLTLKYPTYGTIVVQPDSGVGRAMFGAGTSGGGAAYFGSLDNVKFDIKLNNVVRASFDTNGQFGINDTTPDAQLDVTVGDAARVGQVIDLAASQTADAITVKSSTGDDYFRVWNSNGTKSYLWLSGDGSRGLKIEAGSSGPILIQETGNGAVRFSKAMFEIGSSGPSYYYPALTTVGSNATAASTTATTAEEDLISLGSGLPPGSFTTGRGRRLRLRAYGTTAANSNTKTIRLYFGSTVVSQLSGALNGVTWELEADVFRTGTSTQKYIGRQYISGQAPTMTTGTATENETAWIALKVTGQNGVANAGDITAEALWAVHQNN